MPSKEREQWGFVQGKTQSKGSACRREGNYYFHLFARFFCLFVCVAASNKGMCTAWITGHFGLTVCHWHRWQHFDIQHFLLNLKLHIGGRLFLFLPSGSSWPIALEGPWCLAPSSGNRCRWDKLNRGTGSSRTEKKKGERARGKNLDTRKTIHPSEFFSSVFIEDKWGTRHHFCLHFVFGRQLVLVSMIKRQGVITGLIDQRQRQWPWILIRLTANRWGTSRGERRRHWKRVRIYSETRLTGAEEEYINKYIRRRQRVASMQIQSCSTSLFLCFYVHRGLRACYRRSA